MKVLGIYGSPRAGGNSDRLLDEALRGAREAGAELEKIYVRELEFSGCRECGGCDLTGECVQADDMQKVYPRLQSADAIIIATPMFFYAMPAKLKALVDRAQARWNHRRLGKTAEQRKHYDSGRGYLIAVGATRGENLFEGVELTAQYFYDALDMSYEGGIFIRGVEGKGEIAKQADELQQALELGLAAAGKRGPR